MFALNKVDAINLGKDQGRPDKNANATFKKKVKDYRDYLKDFFFFKVELLVSFMRRVYGKKIKIIITVNLRLNGIYREIKINLEFLMNLPKK